MLPEPRARRAFPVLWPALAAAAMATACAAPAPAPTAAAPVPAAAPKPVAAPPASPLAAAPAAPTVPAEPAISMPVQGGLPGAARPDTSTVSATLLAYADRVRRMPPSELAQELARLSEIHDNVRQPGDDIQLALALAQTRNPGDLARAQSLAARVAGNARDEARNLQPLAALLAARFAEQRRVEDLLDKQSQQVREQQRRIEQLNERLEAVRAIERSLTARPAAPNGAASRPANP